MLELWDECGGGGALPHYMAGRKPGQYPPFTLFRDNVHFVLDLYDPAGFSKNMSEETEELFPTTWPDANLDSTPLSPFSVTTSTLSWTSTILLASARTCLRRPRSVV